MAEHGTENGDESGGEAAAPDPLLEQQQGKGYGADTGEREAALDAEGAETPPDDRAAQQS